ncbi:ERF superfamily protein [Pseudomonas duriflava]|uniref:ERF superfamily protein n=1 Tax=Pseudomonas duriflava TaxID=459528 RepID=A0A562PKX8_9PSED|nr:ERF family protein [Pseudomonas duriflava]TWI45038.1 ERF superfamily protein [Pseudomonas duriflava]
MKMSENIAELAKALAAAQAEIENAAKGSVNPHFKNRYADLAEILNTSRPVLSKHGLSIYRTDARVRRRQGQR